MSKRLQINLSHCVFHEGDTTSLCGKPKEDFPADPEGNARALDAKVVKYGCVKCLRLLIKEYDEVMESIKATNLVFEGFTDEDIKRATDFIRRINSGEFDWLLTPLGGQVDDTAEPEPAPVKKAAARPRKAAAKKAAAKRPVRKSTGGAA